MSSTWPSALTSLDDHVSTLLESLEMLESGGLVDLAQLIEQFESATEYSRELRESLLVERPGASWENREQLAALVQQIAKAKDLEHRRGRLLALASELERGTIVHRREIRVNQLNELCGHAITELRSQARLQSAPALPGPDSGQWVQWACALREPGDAEALETLRSGFPHLDEFVANLERQMWAAQGTEAATVAEPVKPADSKRAEPSPAPVSVPQAAPVAASAMATAPAIAAERTTEPDKAFAVAAAAEPLVAAGPIPPLRKAQESAPPTPAPVDAAQSGDEVLRIRDERRAVLGNPDAIAAELLAEEEEPSRLDSFKKMFHGLATHFDSATPLSGEFWRSRSGMMVGGAALLLLLTLGTWMWYSRHKVGGTTPVQAAESKPLNSDNKGYDPSALSTQGGQTAMQLTPTAQTVQSVAATQSKQNQPADTKPNEKDSAAKNQNASPQPETTQVASVDAGPLRTPQAIPKVAARPDEGAPAAEAPALPGGSNNLMSVARDLPAAKATVPNQKVTTSSGVAQGLLIHKVLPIYPALARQANIQGTVTVQASIAKDGHVKRVEVISGHPILAPAAVDAVKQWRYKPFYLNGEAIETDIQINLNFSPSGSY